MTVVIIRHTMIRSFPLLAFPVMMMMVMMVMMVMMMMVVMMVMMMVVMVVMMMMMMMRSLDMSLDIFKDEVKTFFSRTRLLNAHFRPWRICTV